MAEDLDYFASLLVQTLGRIDGTLIVDGPPEPELGDIGAVAIDLTNKLFYGPKTGDGWGDGEPLIGATGTDGTDGTDGNDAWTPVPAFATDGARRVLKIVDWTGGEGTKPTVNLYVGASGLTATLADAIDVRGAPGTDGTNGVDGTNGTNGEDGLDGSDGLDSWSPILAVVTDGARRVFRVVDWVGGEGTKPTINLYVGATGLTATLADGVDVRGAAGLNGEGSGDVVGPASATANHVPLFDGTTGKLLKDGRAIGAASGGDLLDRDAGDARFQPLDSDLTAIALLTTTTFGRALLTLADMAAARTSLGWGSAAVSATADFLASSSRGAASGVAPLGSDSLIPASYFPPIAITDVFTVASQAAMLALTAEKGDVAVRSDLSKSFILSTNNPGTLADWKELLTPTDVVLAVAGLTGSISASSLRSALSLVIGTDVQAYDADLASIAALTTTTYGRSLLTLANMAALKSSLTLAVADVTGAAAINDAILSKTASYEVVDGDNGKIIEFNSGSGVTLTVAAARGAGFNCQVRQLGAGAVTIAAGTGAARRNRSGYTKTAGQYAQAVAQIAANGTDLYIDGDLVA